MAVVERVAATLRRRRLAHRRHEGEPAPVARWCLTHPLLVSSAVVAVAAAGLFLTFRVLPVPILLILVLLGVGLHRTLVIEGRVYEQWRQEADMI